MKSSYLIPAVFMLSLSAHAATLTKTSQMSDVDVEKFRHVALAAKKVAYADFNTEMVFDVEAFKVSGANSHDTLEPVQEALAKLGYGDAKAVELSDIDDQISDAISAAFSAELTAAPASARAKMEKLVDSGQRYFSEGDERIRVFSASDMDANHYDIGALVVYDVVKQEILAVASQQSE